VALEPLFGLLFDGCSLGRGESGGNKWGESFAGVIAAGAGEDGPKIGMIIIFVYAAAAPIERSQLRLGGNVAMLGSLGEPASRVGFVALDSLFVVSRSIEQAQSVFGRRIAAARQLPKLCEVGRIG